MGTFLGIVRNVHTEVYKNPINGLVAGTVYVIFGRTNGRGLHVILFLLRKKCLITCDLGARFDTRNLQHTSYKYVFMYMYMGVSLSVCPKLLFVNNKFEWRCG